MAEKKCGKQANARFNWAGKDEESYCCEEHGRQLHELCNLMGWHQVFIQLPPDTDKTCQTNIEE